MSWIESHDTLARHPKTRRLVRLLNISTPQAIGHLHLLWWWALEYAEQGDLTAYDDADIADAAMWEGETAIFVGALRTAGFINPDNTIHDWQEYAGKLLAQRKANAERQAAFRNGHKVPQTVPLQPPNTTSNNSHADVIPTDVPRNAPVTVTSQSRNVLTVPITVPDHTVDNLKENEIVNREGDGARTAPPRPQRPRSVPKSAETYVPDDWPITPYLADWWAEQDAPVVIDPSRETEKWQDYHRLKHTKASDWAASWRNWMRKAIEYYQPPAPAGKQGRNGYAAPQRQPDNLTRKLNGTAELFADIDAGTLQGVDRPRGPNVSLLRPRAVSG